MSYQSAAELLRRYAYILAEAEMPPPEENSAQADIVSMSIPLFIRCLEWAHENAKDDIELHKFTENLAARGPGNVLDIDDYESLIPTGAVKEDDAF